MNFHQKSVGKKLYGVNSLRAAAMLRHAGVANVVSMAGGIHLWSVDIDPSVPIY